MNKFKRLDMRWNEHKTKTNPMTPRENDSD